MFKRIFCVVLVLYIVLFNCNFVAKKIYAENIENDIKEFVESANKDDDVENIVQNSESMGFMSDDVSLDDISENTNVLFDDNEKGEVNNPTVNYCAHIQNVGWQETKKNGETAGTTGKSLRMEALKVSITGLEKNVSVKYQAHIQNIGWQQWKADGELAGTEGKGLRLEAIRFRLESSQKYSIMYRAHVQNIGWQQWKVDGEIAGTEGKEYRIEAIEIKVVDKVPKGKICIDSPVANATIYRKDELKISGWKMSNLQNTIMKAYIDNTEIENDRISYNKRNDVINTVSGYGTYLENPTPGFEFTYDVTDFTEGKHEIKIELYTQEREYHRKSKFFFFG